MNDKELIEIIAREWVASGGDSQGFAWCHEKIMAAIKEKEEHQEALQGGEEG